MMKDLGIKKALKRAKEKILPKKSKLICSSKCLCIDDCNTGFAIWLLDDDTLEIFIDWNFAKIKPDLERKMASILVDRKFLTRNLIALDNDVPTKKELISKNK